MQQNQQPIQSQSYQSYDVCASLGDRNVVAFVTRAGQTQLVLSQEGHSVVGWLPVGTIEQATIAPGSNPPFTVSELSPQTLAQIAQIAQNILGNSAYATGRDRSRQGQSIGAGD